jgi:hypothetical protein
MYFQSYLWATCFGSYEPSSGWTFLKMISTVDSACWVLHYLKILTYSMEQSPSWEANRFVASQEIPRVLLNPKVYCRIHNCSPPVSILSEPSPVHTPTSHFLKTSCTPSKSNLHLVNSLAATIREPALYRLLTFQVPNLMSLFRCVGHTKVSVQVWGFVCKCFVTLVFTVRSC